MKAADSPYDPSKHGTGGRTTNGATAGIRDEIRYISDALRYCLQGTTIEGCASPGLMEEALERLEDLAKGAEQWGSREEKGKTMLSEVQCPGCDLRLPEEDLLGQAEHMTERHPEIVAERRAEAARWDGWEDGS